MSTVDLVVIGAGPAGANAALSAAGQGLSVVLLDEAPAVGGQIYRAPAGGISSPDAKIDRDRRAGEELRAAMARSSVDFRLGRRVWSVTEGFRVDALSPAGPEMITAPRLVAATGAHERVVPFEGWTLPGVMGLAAATILLKAEAMIPGRRIVVAGCGPLLVAVAAKVMRAGGEIAALVDLASPGEWLRALPQLASRPGLLAEGMAWAESIARRRVPVFFRHAVLRAEAGPDGDSVGRVVIAPVDALGRRRPGGERSFDVDCLLVGHGLVPGSDVPRLLRAEHRYDRSRGGWVPTLDQAGRTSIAGLYAVGDGAGVCGAHVAALAGEMAGLAAAQDAGRIADNPAQARLQALALERTRAMRFANGIARLMAPRSGLLATIERDVVVCRCEEVTRGQIEDALDAGAREVNQLKHFTRCGMGPCQGRMCGEAAAELVALRVGSREAAGRWTMRTPLRPIGLDSLLGDFSYDDIPVPEPAPL